MSSIRHNGSPLDPGPPGGLLLGGYGHAQPLPSPADDRFLDAAGANILAVGWRRTTITDVAKRAGVSRMTVYRRWPEMKALLADLMVREMTRLVDKAVRGPGALVNGPMLGRLVSGVVATVQAARDDELFVRIVEVDPDLLLPYLLERRGRNQDRILALLESAITHGQRDGSVRDGEPRELARSIVLMLHGFALSAHTMTDDGGPSLADLDRQLAELIGRYLRA